MTEPRSPLSSLVLLEKEKEDARAFLQQRLRRFGRLCFLLQLLSCVAWTLAVALSGRRDARQAQALAPVSLGVTLVPLLVYAAIWLAASRRRLPERTAWTLDAAGSLLVCLAYALVGYRWESLEIAFLPVAFFLLLRAVLLPSSPLRTLCVTLSGHAIALACVPSLLEGAAGRLAPAAPESWVLFFARVFVWILMPIAVSHVLYGLRREVREARDVGPYVLERKIGEGGMGTVYRARHALLRRDTAIKILHAAAADEEGMSRFEREAQATSRLTHPNTVAVYDYGRTPAGRFYYAMEYLPGLDLAAIVDRFGPQPPGRVIGFLAQACSSLAEAHSEGILHRDLKPENLIVCERGGIFDFVKVVDFGLVKRFRGKEDPSLTGPDKVVGTAHYISPEALRGTEKLDARSDLYSLGAVGYFLLTGHRPFRGRDVIEVSVAQLTAKLEKPSRVLGRELPADLEKVVLACLERERDLRPAGAPELRGALMSCQDADAWSQADARRWWERLDAGRPRRNR